MVEISFFAFSGPGEEVTKFISLGCAYKDLLIDWMEGMKEEGDSMMSQVIGLTAG